MFPKELPDTRDARWRLLRAIIDCWFPPARTTGAGALEVREAERRLERELPPAFCEWHTSFGARTDVWCVQDTLFPLTDIRLEGGFLLFAAENQTCWYWGIPETNLHEADPPVFVSTSDIATTWERESDSVSRFALQFAMLNVKFGNGTSWTANGPLTPEAYVAIERRYPLLPFGGLSVPVAPTRFRGSDDIVLEVEGREDGWLWATARDKASLDELRARLEGHGHRVE